jgi:hypothetical protein
MCCNSFVRDPLREIVTGISGQEATYFFSQSPATPSNPVSIRSSALRFLSYGSESGLQLARFAAVTLNSASAEVQSQFLR